MRRKLFIICSILFLLSSSSFASTPLKITIQAILSHKESGLYQGTRNVTIGLYVGDNEPPSWNVTKHVNFQDGWFNTDLGDVNPLTHDIFKNSNLKIKIEINGDTVSLPLRAVPYSIQSRYSETAGSFESADFFAIDRTNERIGIGAPTPSVALEVDGSIKAVTMDATTFTGTFVGNGSLITSLNVNLDNLDRHSLDSADGNFIDVIFVSNSPNVGIGTTVPLEKLDVAGNLLARGIYGAGNTITISGAGTRFLWYPRKAAFRAGKVDGAEWDDSNIGEFSIVFGDKNIGSSDWTAVGGGKSNTASNDYASIGGGWGNTVSGMAAVIAGGQDNVASGTHSFVGGGNQNNATGLYSVVVGGEFNIATRLYATVPGGSKNTASGEKSLAAGYRAKAQHLGSFVWADSEEVDFTSTAVNQFLIRASGGVGIGINNPTEMLAVAGTVNAYAFVGDGSQLTGIDAGTLLQDNDQDTKINVEKTADEDKIRFLTNGTLRMIIDDTGNFGITPNNTFHIDDGSGSFILKDGKVGIGLISPTTILDVSGTVNAVAFIGDGSNITGLDRITDSDNDTNIEVEKNNDEDIIRFTAANTERVYVDSTGIVSMNARLFVKDNLRVGGSLSENNILFYGLTDDDYDGGFNLFTHTAITERLYSGADRSELLLFKGYEQDGSQGDRIRLDTPGSIVFQTGNGNRYYSPGTEGNTRMVINSAGNVGVGLLSPSQKLEVAGTVSASAFIGDGSGITGVTAATSPSADYATTANYALDSDKLDGQEGSWYQDADNVNAGTLGTDRYSAYGDLSAEGYFDNNADSDLLTRIQADGRFVQETATENWNMAYDWDDHSTEGYLVSGNNLSDLVNASTARTNLGLGSGNSPLFAGLGLSGDLQVTGDINATATINASGFIGDGSNLSGITSDTAITANYAVTANYATTAGSAGSSDTATTANVALTANAVVFDEQTASSAIDWSQGTKQYYDVNGAPVTFTFTAPITGTSQVADLVLVLYHSTEHAVTWPGTVKWPGGSAPTLATANGKVNIINFYYRDADDTYYGSSNLDY